MRSSTPEPRDPDEVASRLGFVEEAREAFADLKTSMSFFVISPSRVEFRAEELTVAVEREPHGYEIVGRVRSGERVATFEEIQLLAGTRPVAQRPRTQSEMREVARILAENVVPVVAAGLCNTAERGRLFDDAARARSGLNEQDAAAARRELLDRIRPDRSAAESP